MILLSTTINDTYDISISEYYLLVFLYLSSLLSFWSLFR